jgi:hypothetical protein
MTVNRMRIELVQTEAVARTRAEVLRHKGFQVTLHEPATIVWVSTVDAAGTVETALTYADEAAGDDGVWVVLGRK